MPTDTADQAASPAPAWLPAYLHAREREGRLLSDDLVARLPDLPRDHPLHREWLARADSSARLLAYLRTMEGPLAIVEGGSGNGWLAAAMADIPGATVIGVDANEVELAQARRVFGNRSNLSFLTGDLETMAPPLDAADVIVLASVVQYVADVGALLARLRAWLAEAGEIHLLDSPIYRREHVAAARERTRAHYAAVGVPEMADAYHHHTWADFEPFHPTTLLRPEPTAGRFLRRLAGRVETPFPWLVIRRDVSG
jgi:protein-L-isoaspartate O-methyltransferase